MIRYDKRKGWVGWNSRALYEVRDKHTGAVTIRDGYGLRGVGEEARIRLATASQARAAGWPEGWIVRRETTRRTYRAPRSIGHFA